MTRTIDRLTLTIIAVQHPTRAVLLRASNGDKLFARCAECALREDWVRFDPHLPAAGEQAHCWSCRRDLEYLDITR
jgi:hypothetical protein